MTHEELKECIGEYRELKKDLWWANCWGVQKVDGYNFGIHYNDFAGHWQFSWNDPENEHRVADVEDIFDSQEECEEYWEFGNVTRTERLPYISWNERDCIIFTFTSPKFKTYEFRLFKGGNITIWRTDDMYKVFNEPTTKENYDNARRLCVKLFKGESV